MKFLVTKEWQRAPFLKMLMGGVAFFLLLFLATDVVLHHFQTGMSLSRTSEILFGNEAAFVDPVPLGTLLLWVHIDLFAGMLTVLILSAIAIRTSSSAGKSTVWLHLLSLPALLAPITLSVAYLTSMQWMVVLWLGCFMLWHIMGVALCVVILRRVWR